MSDIVIVAVIGVLGTLVGSIAAPIVKDRVDRASRSRASDRAELRSRVLTISQILNQMVRLGEPDRQERAQLSAQLSGELAVFRLLVPKGESEVVSTVETAMMFAHAGVSAVDRSVNPVVTSATVQQLAQWYRGERKAKGMSQEWFDLWTSMRSALVNGTMMPGGVPIPDADLTESELAERVTYREGAA